MKLLYSSESCGFLTSPSTDTWIPPSGSNFKPVAVTMMSASSVLPDSSRMPVLVNRAMRSVTTDALPRAIVRNRSASGTAHKR